MRVLKHGLEELALLHHPSSDDGLLAFEVETALKALGIASDRNGRTEGDLRTAVEDLRRASDAGARSGLPLRVLRLDRVPQTGSLPAFLTSDEDAPLGVA